jgi:uncharacterized membrane protein YfcA
MEYVAICLAAIIASGLTLFSGFGLATLLMPVFALFFPVEVAIALTAIVHFLNNLFKLILVGRHTEKSVVLQFGVSAIIFAYLGAKTLITLSGLTPLASYRILGKAFQITPLKLVIAVLLVVFAMVEVLPRIAQVSFERRYLPLGGALSGFLGGLSGHQGALRRDFQR